MLNSLNTQLFYNSNSYKFSQNPKLLEENSMCEPMATGASNYPTQNEVDQYLNSLIQGSTGPVICTLNPKSEDTRLAHTDCEDSGFVTSSSSISSPQLSPNSLSPAYSSVDTNTSASHPFEDYTQFSSQLTSQLTFQGIAGSSNWNLESNPLPNSTLMVTKEIKHFNNYPSKSSIHNCELRIVKQPECHHRARYMTEGSRGTIKDRTGRGNPIVQLFGYNKCAVKLQCFIGHDQKMGEPHLFYQACEVSGKTVYKYTKVNGINMIELELQPKNNMQTVIDCMGILKERNVDVERKVLRNRKRCHSVSTTASEEAKVIRTANKGRSTHCRMVFRCILPDTGEVLQTVSDAILCTQPLGSPEIYKISIRESDVKGGHELFIIGKNFHKDSKVIFTSGNHWRKAVNPMKEFLNSTHLVCQIPAYDGIDSQCHSILNADISVNCNHKTSDPIKFIYTNPSFVSNNLIKY